MSSYLYLLLFFVVFNFSSAYSTFTFAHTEVTEVDGNMTLKEIKEKLGVKDEVIFGALKKTDSNTFLVTHSYPACSLKENLHHRLCIQNRTRSLSQVNFTTSGLKTDIATEINKRKGQPSIGVLEMGMGQGRVLADLAIKYPEVNFHGINREKGEHGFSDTKDLIEVATFFKLKNNPGLKDFQKVNLHFKDLSEGKLEMFANESLDIVYSFATILYLTRKDELLREVWRVLKPNGVAFLQIHLMFIEDKRGRKVKIEDYFKNNLGPIVTYDVETKLLMLTKKSTPFNLNLKFNKNKSKEDKNLIGRESVFTII